MIIVYTDKCLTCTHKPELKALKAFARSINQKVEIRRTTYNPVLKAEADKLSDIKTPYAYNPDTRSAVALKGVDYERLCSLV